MIKLMPLHLRIGAICNICKTGKSVKYLWISKNGAKCLCNKCATTVDVTK